MTPGQAAEISALLAGSVRRFLHAATVDLLLVSTLAVLALLAHLFRGPGRRGWIRGAAIRLAGAALTVALFEVALAPQRLAFLGVWRFVVDLVAALALVAVLRRAAGAPVAARDLAVGRQMLYVALTGAPRRRYTDDRLTRALGANVHDGAPLRRALAGEAPAAGLTGAQADTYCRVLSLRLPTAEEWSAAHGLGALGSLAAPEWTRDDGGFARSGGPPGVPAWFRCAFSY